MENKSKEKVKFVHLFGKRKKKKKLKKKNRKR